MTHSALIAKAFQMSVLGLIVLGGSIFIPAGTFGYPEAWIFMALFVVPSVLITSYLFKKDPKLLERRMRMREKEKEQRWIMGLSYPFFFAIYIIPGFDYRYGWSDVSFFLVIVADVIILLSWILLFLVLKENSYASRVIEVEQDQKVISTGPYAIVRHPMYVGGLLLLLFSPLALGSYVGLIPAAISIFVIVARILNEEKVLSEKLEGYTEYMKKTKYRLIPGIW